ncbi:DsbE family thiol:disulfide interchange protein [Ferrovibrio sp.]|uniref:DsbE family thiol:disulfide interchange protein n=1 Tax=Ferrovibrio sp. TaxID=1917215 RepID=UPI00351733CE
MDTDFSSTKKATMVGPRQLRRMAVVPVAVFVVLSVLLGIGLTLKPREIPSVLIGKPAPQFGLPPVQGRSMGFSTSDLLGRRSLVNVFASWCVACRDEHPILMDIASDGSIPVYGLNYKDAPRDAEQWLDEFGDPYTRTGADITGRVAIDWGVYGVPETFVVDVDGKILHKQIGPLTRATVDSIILPFFSPPRLVQDFQ